ncbi:hypothetical protein GCM10023222_33540 [Saccharopolyspora cebuensis]
MTGTTHEPAVVARLSTLDRFLPVWIGVAMLVGLLAGRWIPGSARPWAWSRSGASLPIALGLLVMMHPVLTKVRYGRPAPAAVLPALELGVRPALLGSWSRSGASGPRRGVLASAGRNSLLTRDEGVAHRRMVPVR